MRRSRRIPVLASIHSRWCDVIREQSTRQEHAVDEPRFQHAAPRGGGGVRGGGDVEAGAGGAVGEHQADRGRQPAPPPTPPAGASACRPVCAAARHPPRGLPPLRSVCAGAPAARRPAARARGWRRPAGRGCRRRWSWGLHSQWCTWERLAPLALLARPARTSARASLRRARCSRTRTVAALTPRTAAA